MAQKEPEDEREQEADGRWIDRNFNVFGRLAMLGTDGRYFAGEQLLTAHLQLDRVAHVVVG